MCIRDRTQPVHGAVRADQSSGMQIPDDGVVLDPGHWLLSLRLEDNLDVVPAMRERIREVRREDPTRDQPSPPTRISLFEGCHSRSVVASVTLGSVNANRPGGLPSRSGPLAWIVLPGPTISDRRRCVST